MSESRGSCLILLSLCALAGPAAAQSSDFATCANTSTACSATVTSCCTAAFPATAAGKAILIPLDRCHQPLGTGDLSPPGPGAPWTGSVFNLGQGWCVDSPGTDATRIGGTASDDGMFKAYGLVYRLMQRGIPVYWLINTTKTPPALTASQNLSSQTYVATDVDLWVLGSGIAAPPASLLGLTDCLTPTSTPAGTCTQPVHRLEKATLVAKLDSYRKNEFPIRGGAFLIAPEDRPKFNAFYLRTGDYASLAGQTKYDWSLSGIDMYEVDSSARIVYQNFNSGAGTPSSPYGLVEGAPVALKIDAIPPRIARVGQTNAVATSWLAKAGLDDPATAASCPSGEFVPSDATYCNVSDTQIQGGVLISGGFEWAWVDDYDYGGTPCGSQAEKAMFDKLRDFMTAFPGLRNAGHSLYLSRSINVSEGCADKQLMGKVGSGGLTVSTGTPPAEPYILRYPANLLSQWGDVPTSFASGGVASWTYGSTNAAIGYSTLLTGSPSTLRRIATSDATASGSNPQCTNHASSATCDLFTPGSTAGDIIDIAAYARFANKVINGIVLYVGGNQLSNSATSLRIVLGSLIANPDETVSTTPVDTEVSRSTPIVLTIDGVTSVYQGTYVNQNPPPSVTKAVTSATLSRFKFPYLTGHLRQIPIDAYQTTRRTFATIAASATFDAADNIPTVNPAGCSTKFNGSCRTVFTTSVGGRLPDHLDFTTGNVATLGPIMAPNLTTAEQQTLISRVLAGYPNGSGGYIPKLGGIDRSTVAVIPESPIAGGARPTMAYVGATDGMLHAICVTTGNGCDRPGRELWAYIPRKVLANLRTNVVPIQGSPRVIDAYGDFYNTNTKVWRTVLIFQMGSGSMNNLATTPAVYAIDITKPNQPRVLWEYSVSTVTSRSEYELGVGLTVTAGAVDMGGNVTNYLVFAQTNNGGTAGAASVTTAINLENGAKVWQHNALYPAPRTNNDEPLPLSGVPGGAVAIDKNGNGKYSDVVLGTLYGTVWQLDAATGISRHGATTPLFRTSTDYHPIGVPAAIYSKNGTQYAAFATGGYYDTATSLWNGVNVSPKPLQYGFSVTMSRTVVGGTPLNENSGGTDVPIKQNFAQDVAGFAQPIVVGNEVFFVGDSTNINVFEYGTTGSTTGLAYRYDFGTNTAGSTPAAVSGGAASLGNSGVIMLSGTGTQGERLGTNAAGTTGTAVSQVATATTKLLRKLWLRTE